jgi:renalase
VGVNINQVFDFVIVGAGISGLSLAAGLKKHETQLKIKIVEKSKGVGGRIATRRDGESRYDHGLQWIESDPNSAPWVEKWIQNWKDIGVLKIEAADGKDLHFCPGGMTQIAKILAQNLEIELNWKLTEARKNEEGLWHLKNSDGSEMLTRYLLITSPLPQALEFLKASHIEFPKRLSEIKYSKALVALIQTKEDVLKGRSQLEHLSSGIELISSGASKGLSLDWTYTVIMNPSWSGEHFEGSYQEIRKHLEKALHNQFSGLDGQLIKFDLKKWRYCRPLQIFVRPFHWLDGQNIALFGDAFGGPDLAGALKSSEELLKFISQRIDKKRHNL